MNRRGFLTACASLLPLPAFVRASSLWLPPERPLIVEPFDFVADWRGPISYEMMVTRKPNGVVEYRFARTDDPLRKWTDPTMGIPWEDMAQFEYDSTTKTMCRLEP